MWIIRELDSTDKNYVQRLARLHVKAFPSFFLTQLGIPFLKTLYDGYLQDSESGVIVAEDKEGRLLGFIAYSNDYSAFYRGLIKKKIVQFAWCSFMAVLRHPSFTKRLLGAFKKSDSVVKEENYVELASICVNPKAGGKGVGSGLIDYLKTIVDFDKYAYINLETDADNNDSVNQFYVKNGFVLDRQYVTAEGRRMNEYRYTPAASDSN